jgi:3-phenylpropionate/cinnamic acid dioxygenase small subunit
MLLDRVMAVTGAIVHAPRIMRHAITNVQILSEDADVIRTRAVFAIYETFAENMSRVFAVGRYLDAVVRDGNRFAFREKICVYDGSLVPGSLIYPM